MRGIALTLGGSTAPAYADRDAVKQIATNLLSNALKYAPAHKPVRLATDASGGMARISVHDSGTLPATGRERLFERFYRGSSRGGSGAGLGLTIARSLAEAQGGYLDVEVEESGVSFTLSLPIDRDSSIGRGQQRRPERGRWSSPFLGSSEM